MSLFDIKPWIVKKKDGTKKQVMPQTTIKGVIGLEKELNSIKSVVENSTEELEKNITAQQGSTDWVPVPEGTAIKVVTQAQYDALTDKSGLYVIQG